MRLEFLMLRVAGLCAFTVILWAKPEVTNAQYGGACFTYSLVELDCGSCCSSHNHIDEINTPSGAGIMTQVEATLACGTAAPGDAGSRAAIKPFTFLPRTQSAL